MLRIGGLRSDLPLFIMRSQKPKIHPSHASGSMVVAYELPLIQQGENILISAKLLHKKLKVRTSFAHWFQRRIEKYGFEEGQDFCLPTLASKKEGRGGHNAVDYLLSLDMAKEMAMLEENEIGRHIRRYFIAKEKEARGISNLPKEREVFKGLPRKRINDRIMLPYAAVKERCGYSRRSSSATHRHRYWMHFIKEGNQLWVTEAFAQHLYHQKQVFINRAAMLNAQPVLPFNFGSQIEGGKL